VVSRRLCRFGSQRVVVVTRTASVDRRLRARRALQVKYADGANVLHPRLTSYVVREVAILLDLANNEAPHPNLTRAFVFFPSPRHEVRLCASH
jgi:hypothetical protein